MDGSISEVRRDLVKSLDDHAVWFYVSRGIRMFREGEMMNDVAVIERWDEEWWSWVHVCSIGPDRTEGEIDFPSGARLRVRHLTEDKCQNTGSVSRG